MKHKIKKWLITLFICLFLCLAFYGIIRLLYFQKLKSYSFDKLKTIALNKLRKNLDDPNPLIIWTSVDQINPKALHAIILSEDSTFYDHSGINYIAIKDAFFYNLKRKRFARGGSTISQQVAKNLLLNKEKSLIRKFKEFFVTQTLESKFSKEQILELYLNIAEFGPNIYGIYSASHHFFRKTPIQLNPAEGAFISLMLPAPERYYYEIYQNQSLDEKNLERIQRILTEMHTFKKLSDEEYQRYMIYSFF